MNPNDHVIHHNIGLIKRRQGDNQGALAKFYLATKLDPTYAPSYNQRAVTYVALGDKEAALEQYNKALLLRSPSTIQKAEIYHNRGVLREEMDQLDLAISDYRRAIETSPYLYEAYQNLAALYRRQEKYDEAIAEVIKGVQYLPRSSQLYRIQGMNYAARGDHLRQNGDQDRADSDHERAVGAYRAAVRLNPNDYFAHHNIGAIYYNKKEWHSAIHEFTAAIYAAEGAKIAAYHPALYNRGLAYAELGNTSSAIADFRKIVSDPERDDLKEEARRQLSYLE
jgi:tetratricopeptide (TPR) repeat protein